MMEFDTIAAISTPMGEGAIAIVRLSGPDAVAVADRVYKGTNRLTEVPTHTIHYGKLVDHEADRVVDEVMVSVMRAPKTFTREDVIELNCHGGVVAVNRVLELILAQPEVRLAEPGEFTKRAFLNGRIDLSQAEAVMDLIRAKTDRAMHVAVSQIEGRLSKLVQDLRQQLLQTIAAIEVNIDYPEYDAEEMTQQIVERDAGAVRAILAELLTTARQGKILREGLSTAIIGRPNVGKSSLLNTLVQEAKAIVTDIAGTTRDTIEEYVNVRGVPLKLIDTAGIRETEDIVERMGVEKSRQALKTADLILLVLNGNDVLTDEDVLLFEAIKGMNAIIIVNKSDLAQQIDLVRVTELADGRPIVTTSLLEEAGVNDLEAAIASLFFEQGVESQDMTYVSNARHIQLIKRASQMIEDALGAAEAAMPIDMVQIDLRRAWDTLGEINGDTAQDSLLDQLFSQFCLGK
ncbi:tRNA uridine-5-carboxymethylaminomethyl(34) synthesis GTPase MnmE [Exiguobacterium acetylicum]|uniref:tRNA uridine-5-carboxymethylaminomethyl(34) synthesis GTPase MnmE n=1 Tax=Exiguobacterium TaxID=33986 RepID=UPI0006FA08C2|nr:MULTISPECIES: tRNA uridine-5-carboxymethylaminomethyl(34) synthesis GTPase MnmE [Exiguobacterium]KQS36461.1 tRNA modification GTPase [Exiguobacterium sp. Leaf196]MDQ6468541.1 tRNA uridine-5-carboxymethylaminomethyl(34) synthesis GTPase MnmE [Exiguobacterium acetylicum]HAZ39654.1 tRNA uridine-5-carboxymethylaminomethyl(34) synthesis GTPase MnmE [Exiguobacterium sp.]